MINYKSILNIIGSLLFIEALFFLLCQGLALCFQEHNWKIFGLPFLTATALGFFCKQLGKKNNNKLNRRDAYLILSLTWIIFSLLGMLPFLIGGVVENVASAFFETMSGFTTTGASILNNIDELPKSLLFWRSLTQWIGGLGIVFFTLAILPSVGMSDTKLFSAESTGFKIGKLHPRFSVATKWLWSIYLILTISCAVALYLAGMNVFDSINHSLCTTATGGFSTHQASIAYYQSPAIEYVEAIFMFLVGINFGLLYLGIVKRNFTSFLKDGELKTYMIVCFGITFLIAGSLIFQHNYGIEKAFRMAFFHVTSVQSTTGFMATDVMLWPSFAIALFLILLGLGGSAGSTSGGYKCVRLYAAYKYAINELMLQLHPHAVLQVKFGKGEGKNIGHALIAFTFFFFILSLIGILAFLIMGYSFTDAFSLSVSSLANVGPAFGHEIGATDSWSTLNDSGKWLASFLMLAGRLEIFSVLLPFYSHFWKED